MEKRKYTMEDHLHRKDSPISAMCAFFWVSRRGYDDFVRRLGRPEPDRGVGTIAKRAARPCTANLRIPKDEERVKASTGTQRLYCGV